MNTINQHNIFFLSQSIICYEYIYIKDAHNATIMRSKLLLFV